MQLSKKAVYIQLLLKLVMVVGLQKEINVQVIPPLNLNINQDDFLICPGQAIKLHAFGADLYEWHSDDYVISEPNQGLIEVAPKETSTFYVIGKNECFEEMQMTTVDIIENEIKLIKDTTVQRFSKFTLSIDQVESVEWSSNLKLSCDTCFNPSVRANHAGHVQVQYKDEYGCIWDNTIAIHVSNKGIRKWLTKKWKSLFEDNADDDLMGITLFPSITSRYLNVEIDEEMVGGEYVVINSTGKLIQSGEITNANSIMEFGNHPDGSYSIIVSKNGIVLQNRFLLMKY